MSIPIIGLAPIVIDLIITARGGIIILTPEELEQSIGGDRSFNNSR